jgi:hypothetical protein
MARNPHLAVEPRPDGRSAVQTTAPCVLIRCTLLRATPSAEAPPVALPFALLACQRPLAALTQGGQ